MAESTQENQTNTPPAGRNKEEVALDLMKFVATTTGYGKGNAAVGFAGKAVRTPEEYADALLELYDRCRKVLG